MKEGISGLCRRGSLLACAVFLLCACESGEKAVDEFTGNRAVKQYHKSTKDVERITDQQTRKFQTVPQEAGESGEKE